MLNFLIIYNSKYIIRTPRGLTIFACARCSNHPRGYVFGTHTQKRGKTKIFFIFFYCGRYKSTAVIPSAVNIITPQCSSDAIYCRYTASVCVCNRSFNGSEIKNKYIGTRGFELKRFFLFFIILLGLKK